MHEKLKAASTYCSVKKRDVSHVAFIRSSQLNFDNIKQGK